VPLPRRALCCTARRQPACSLSCQRHRVPGVQRDPLSSQARRRSSSAAPRPTSALGLGGAAVRVRWSGGDDRGSCRGSRSRAPGRWMRGDSSLGACRSGAPILKPALQFLRVEAKRVSRDPKRGELTSSDTPKHRLRTHGQQLRDVSRRQECSHAAASICTCRSTSSIAPLVQSLGRQT
jgi:hypothetical protein